MTVEADLFSRVKTYAGFVSLAATRIYYFEAPQNATYPYATFSRVSSVRHHFMGADADIVHARFQFDTWGSTPDSSRALLEQVRLAIQRYSGTGTVTILDILIEGDLDLPESEENRSLQVFHSSLDAIVIYRE
jgi:hypothetical protein